MKYRSREDIVKAILTTCRTPAKKTWIMYSARLSYTQLEEYIKLVFLERELIDYKPSNAEYILNGKGREYLKNLEKL